MKTPNEVKPRLLKVKEAAEFLSISTWKLRALIANRELPYIQLGESRAPFLLDVDDLNTFIGKHKKVY